MCIFRHAFVRFVALHYSCFPDLSVNAAGSGGHSHMKRAGMLVVLLRGVNFGFWSRLKVF